MINKIALLLTTVILSATTIGAASADTSSEKNEVLNNTSYQKPAGDLLSADMYGADGDKIGYATFRRAPRGVLITLNLDRLNPGWHGVSIYDKALCDIPSHFKDTKDHFTKQDEQHGFLNPNGPHTGDLPNVWVSAEGNAKAQFFTEMIKLDNLVGDHGTSIIIHSGMDDFMSQPTGNAGDKIACGVITVK